ncbi:MAG: hypothetical protein AB7V16_07280 [Vulcanibacillus sp.]
MTTIENIQISERDLNEIKKAIGYPTITNEFAHIATDEQIKEYSIAPALNEFYRWFPMSIPKEISTSGGSLIEVECEENVVGIYKQHFVPSTSSFGNLNPMSQGMFLANPFASANQVSYLSQNTRGFGTQFNYEFSQFAYQSRFLSESMEASNSGYYIDYDEYNNKLKVKSLISGVFYIELAAVDNDVGRIPFRLRPSFIKYAQSMLLENFAFILGMSESDLPSSLDVDALREKSDTLKEEVLTYWRESSIGMIMR